MLPFYYNIGLSWVIFTVIAAVGPAVILMVYVYKQDKYDKEPGYMVRKTLLGGVYAALLSMVLEWLFSFLLGSEDSIEEAIMVGLVEEGAKLFFLYRATWNSPEFNYRFDGIVYSALVSLGFAAFENVGYVLSYGSGVIVTRALLSIPAHMAFGVLNGILYSKAKQVDIQTGHGSALIVFGWLAAAALHATFDGCLMVESDSSMAVFAGIVVLVYVIVFIVLRKESKNDAPLYE